MGDLGAESQIPEPHITHGIPHLQLEGEPSAEIAPTTAEVLQWVRPEGLCAGLFPLKIRERPFSEDVKAKIKGLDREEPVLLDLEEKTAPVRGFLKKLITNDDLYQRALAKDEEETFTETDIQDLANFSDPRIQHRALEVINRGIDPDLLPFILQAIHGGYGFSLMPASFTEALAASQDARDLLADFLAMKKSVVTDIKKNMFIELMTRTYQVLRPTDATGAQAIRDFTDYSLFYRGNNYLDELTTKALKNTHDAYFQHSVYPGGWSFDSNTLYEADTKTEIVQFARALEIGKFLVSTHRKVDEIFRDYFPEMYVPGAVKKISLVTEKRTDNAKEGNPEFLDDGNAWYDGSGGVGIRTGKPPEAKQSTLIAVEPEKIFPGMPKEGKKLVVYTIIFMHEEAHAMYGALVLGDEMQAAVNMAKYDKTADHALNEGTAVLLEMLAIDLLIEKPGLLFLDDKDVQTLKDHKLARYKYLKDRQNGYTEGMHRILHRIYGQAIGPAGDRDNRRGLKAVREFLESVDPRKTLTVSRESPEYQGLLRVGEPRKWKEFFSK